jgi:hypothetical protein
MKGFKSQYLEDFCSDHEVALEFHLRRNGSLKVTEERKIAYQLPNGTPVFTDNPELENQFDTSATWTDEDDAEIKAWMENFEMLFDELKSAFNKLEVGQPKYFRLTKELKRAHGAWNDLRNDILGRVCFCRREKLNLTEIDYSGDQERVRQEEVETNQYIERREKL